MTFCAVFAVQMNNQPQQQAPQPAITLFSTCILDMLVTEDQQLYTNTRNDTGAVEDSPEPATDALAPDVIFTRELF